MIKQLNKTKNKRTELVVQAHDNFYDDDDDVAL